MTSMRHTSFKAIADPTRREIIALLVEAREPLTISSITERFKTSRQAITKHLKILHHAGLVDIRKRGRERYCSFNADPLREVHDWVSVYVSMRTLEMPEPQSLLHVPGRIDAQGEEKQDLSGLRVGIYRAVSAV